MGIKKGKRELIDTGTDKRYVKRNADGTFVDSVDVGRSLAADRRSKSKTVAKADYGDQGDRDAGSENVTERGSEGLTWCCVPVTIDNDTSDLFAMPKPDDDPKQMPAFVVTQSTANLVQQDFELYRPSLESMAEDWRKAKNSFSFQ